MKTLWFMILVVCIAAQRKKGKGLKRLGWRGKEGGKADELANTRSICRQLKALKSLLYILDFD
jgi:hypothetical protein